VLTSLFDYELPESSIAQRPLSDRAASRMLVVGRSGVEHARFRDFPALIPEGALLVVNDTRVHKARLVGTRRGSGGRVEFLLLQRETGEPGPSETWLAVGRANRRIDAGAVVDAGALSVEVLSRDAGGLLRVAVHAPGGVERALERDGHVPLPPYIRRPDDREDVERYQTIFSEKLGSAAAPTAGLHFTSDVMEALQARAVRIGAITLHVGLGTFRPVSCEDIDQHAMHTERYEIGEDLASEIRACHADGRKVVAVGTTVVRALESAKDPANTRQVLPTRSETTLLIQPGYAFGPVDALLTNFHMPKSTLLALVAAFAGRERILSAYRAAVEAGYRFLSYGDAMWIPERLEAP
jgi:S-adenosylmethionine:tRNA ribosyltransferase-isomerase